MLGADNDLTVGDDGRRPTHVPTPETLELGPRFPGIPPQVSLATIGTARRPHQPSLRQWPSFPISRAAASGRFPHQPSLRPAAGSRRMRHEPTTAASASRL
jgi:hypothetical protein